MSAEEHQEHGINLTRNSVEEYQRRIAGEHEK